MTIIFIAIGRVLVLVYLELYLGYHTQYYKDTKFGNQTANRNARNVAYSKLIFSHNIMSPSPFLIVHLHTLLFTDDDDNDDKERCIVVRFEE